MDIKKKSFILLSTYVLCLNMYMHSKNNNKNYNINYVTNKIETPYDKNNIYILDDRSETDPNIVVYNSSDIIDIFKMNDIIDDIIEYEEKNPSEWNRSKKSMLKEWIYHDIAYYLNIQQNRTKDVDFNNADEEAYAKGGIDSIKLILKTYNK